MSEKEKERRRLWNYYLAVGGVAFVVLTVGIAASGQPILLDFDLPFILGYILGGLALCVGLFGIPVVLIARFIYRKIKR